MLASMQPRTAWFAAPLLACTPTAPSSQATNDMTPPAAHAASPAAPAAPPTNVTDPTRWSLRRELAGCKFSTTTALGDDMPEAHWSPGEAENSQEMVLKVRADTHLWVSGGDTPNGPMLGFAWQRDGHAHVLLRPIDGPPTLVFDIVGPKGCTVDRVQFGPDTASFIVAGLLFVGPFHDDPAWSTPYARWTDGHILHARTILRFDGSSVRHIERGDSPSTPASEEHAWVAAAGDAIVFATGKPGDGASLVRPDGPPREIIDIKRDQLLGGLTAYDDQLYWIVADIDGAKPRDPDSGHRERGFGDAALWSAKLPAGDSPLTARRVGNLAGIRHGPLPQLVADHERVAYTTSASESRTPDLNIDLTASPNIHLFNLSTGRHEDIGHAGFVRIARVVLLTKNEIVLAHEPHIKHPDATLIRYSLGAAP